MFNDLKNDGLEKAEDRIGGFTVFDAGIYTGKIKQFYGTKAASGAKAVNVILDLDGREYRETIYVTNKAGENWFYGKDSKGVVDKTKKVPLPGFTTADHIALCAAGMQLAELEWEDKMVNIYDADAKKEIPKSVPVATNLLGLEISVGIVKVLENKNKKADNGEYVATKETREVNQIEKVFNTETHLTVSEAEGGREAAFWGLWEAKNKGQLRDKRTIKDGQGGPGGVQSGRPGGAGKTPSGPPQANTAGAAPRKSLFGNKAAAA